ncbi:MAG: DedA family protein [Acidobacteria bacterium]|jgi:membrane-associated protein|nr:MAG: DedA family protein [Acidobacteriota bacterium]GIU81389.1 MAG: membrane protein [Pyrinomonadaceae bacterium]
MELIQEFLHYLNPKVIIETLLSWLGNFAYVGLFVIVFVETGLAFGFFLPGDSLLVVAGLFAAAGKLDLWVMLISLFIAAVLGDAVGYYSGKKVGPAIFKRPKSRFFNPKHLQRAHEFYEKHGGKTIILARFVPIVRTFAPIVAGAAQMRYRDFFIYNVVGGFLWVSSMLFTGYFLGEAVERALGIKLEDHIEKVVVVVVLLSITPIFYEYYKERKARKTEVFIEEEISQEIS